MARNLIIVIALHLLFCANIANDNQKSYSIKSNLPDAQVLIYDNWVKNVLDSFYNIGPGKKLEFSPTIVISNKKNAWPIRYVFYGENFFGLPPVKISTNRIEVSPNKEILGLGNNEFYFKQAIANHLINNNIKGKIPFWFEKGFAAYVAFKGGDKNWIERNYAYILFLSVEKKETKSIDQILKFKTNFDTKERFLQEAYCWALVNWLMTQKDFVEAPNKILSFSNTENINSFEELKNKNAEWVKYLETTFYSKLPSQISISSECEIVLNTEDLTGLFFTMHKRGKIITDGEIVTMLGANIQEATYQNLVKLASSMQPTVREFAIRTLGLIPNRSSLSEIISIAYNDPSEAVRLACARAIRNLNMGIAPKDLIDALGQENPNLIGQAALTLASIRDTTVAKTIIEKLGSIRPESNTFSVVNTKNYIKDLDVVDGVLVPVIGVYEVGFESKETFLWVIELKNKMIQSLNQLPLNHQAKTAELWFKWYHSQ